MQKNILSYTNVQALRILVLYIYGYNDVHLQGNIYMLRNQYISGLENTQDERKRFRVKTTQ